jgi:hypothetical protein
MVSASSACGKVASSLKHSNKPAGSTKVQENLECLSNNVQLKESCGMGTLAEMIKSIASPHVSCDINNNVKIFQQESILISYSSGPSHRVAEESTEETLRTA